MQFGRHYLEETSFHETFILQILGCERGRDSDPPDISDRLGPLE